MNLVESLLLDCLELSSLLRIVYIEDADDYLIEITTLSKIKLKTTKS